MQDVKKKQFVKNKSGYSENMKQNFWWKNLWKQKSGKHQNQGKMPGRRQHQNKHSYTRLCQKGKCPLRILHIDGTTKSEVKDTETQLSSKAVSELLPQIL